MDSMMIIYKATNKINKMSYIGQTVKNLNRRIQQHANDAKRCNQFFYRALRKYGMNNFNWSIIKKCENIQELNIWEKYYILFFNTKKPYGYNLTDGGQNGAPFKGHKHSEETKNIIKKRLREIYSTPEIREKISNALKGRKHSISRNKKNGDVRRGKTFIELYGEERAKIFKKKLSDFRKGKPGKKHNEMTKNKIRVASRKWHKEHPNNNGLIGKNHPLQGKGGTFLGKYHSEEAKKKIREKRKQWFRQNPGVYDGPKNPNWRQDNV